MAILVELQVRIPVKGASVILQRRKRTLAIAGTVRKGVYLDDVRISASGKKSDYDAYIKEKEEQCRLLKKRWSQKRYDNLYDDTWFVVKTKNIKELL